MKHTLTIAAALAVVSGTALAENTDMITACTQTANDYVWYLDHPGDDLDATAAQFAQLFTEDAILKLANSQMEMVANTGPEEIATRYLQGRDSLRFLHSLTNQRINPTSETTANGTSYVNFYIHPIGADMNHERSFTGVAEYRSTFEYKDGACKFTYREGLLRFLTGQDKITDPLPE